MRKWPIVVLPELVLVKLGSFIWTFTYNPSMVMAVARVHKSLLDFEANGR